MDHILGKGAALLEPRVDVQERLATARLALWISTDQKSLLNIRLIKSMHHGM